MKAKEMIEKIKGKIDGLRALPYRAAAAVTVAALPAMGPALAYAADGSATANEILKDLLDIVQKGLYAVGVFMIVWGGVKIGIGLREQQGAAEMHGAMFTMAGGAVVIAAGAMLSMVKLQAIS